MKMMKTGFSDAPRHHFLLDVLEDNRRSRPIHSQPRSWRKGEKFQPIVKEAMLLCPSQKEQTVSPSWQDSSKAVARRHLKGTEFVASSSGEESSLSLSASSTKSSIPFVVTVRSGSKNSNRGSGPSGISRQSGSTRWNQNLVVKETSHNRRTATVPRKTALIPSRSGVMPNQGGLLPLLLDEEEGWATFEGWEDMKENDAALPVHLDCDDGSDTWAYVPDDATWTTCGQSRVEGWSSSARQHVLPISLEKSRLIARNLESDCEDDKHASYANCNIGLEA